MTIARTLRHSGTALMVAASLALAACSSGGPGDASDAPSSGSTTANGVASKGPIQNATVTAIELDANGRELRNVGTATTGEDGRYTLRIGSNYGGGPILFELGPTQSARMICDLPTGCGDTAFGESYRLDQAIELRAIVPSAQRDSAVSVQITPFTTLAADRVLNGDYEVSDRNIRRANSEVSDILGMNVLATEPTDLTQSGVSDDDDGKTYGAFLIALAALAASDEIPLSEFLENLRASFEDGVFNGNDSVDLHAFVSTLEDVSLAVFPEGDTPSKLLAAISRLYDKLEQDGSYDPEPDQDADKPEIARAQALLDDVRARWASIEQLDNPLAQFEQELEAAENTFSGNGLELVQAANAVLETVFESIYDSDQGLRTGDHLVDIYDDTGTFIGQIPVSVTEDSSGTAIDIAHTELQDGTAIELLLASDLRVAAIKSELMASLMGAAGTEFDLSARVASDAASFEITGGELVAKLGGLTTGTLALDAVSFGGRTHLSDDNSGLSFAGNLKIKTDVNVTQHSRPSEDDIERLYINATGEFATPSQSFDARLIADGRNGADFALGSLSLAVGLGFIGDPDTTATVALRRVDADSTKAQLGFAGDGENWSARTKLHDGQDLSYLEILNSNGVIIYLVNEGGDKITGHIEVDNKNIAKIKPLRDKVPTIYWNDGRFESLL